MNQKGRYSLLRLRTNYLLIAALLACLASPSGGAVRQSQISQFGITWTFNKNYVVGQFANGDWWVVGPVIITGISPASIESDGRVINGSMVNPSPRLVRKQGYDSAMYGLYAKPGDYEASLNVARPNDWELSKDNALVVNPDSSLVSTISTAEVEGSTRLKVAAVLTVLDGPAPEWSFRPAYCGDDKTIRFNKEQLDYSLLASLRPVPGAPSLATVERYFERMWLDHVPLWMGRSLHPADNMPDYAREMATQVGIGAVMLHLDFSNEEKERLLVSYVQLGIDFYGITQDGGESNWTGMGGHANGRKYPILFAGLVLGDDDMTNIGSISGDYLYSDGYGPGNAPPDYVHFGEDDQTFYVAQEDVDATHSPEWNPDRRDVQRIPYELDDIGLPEWGIVHTLVPEQSNKYWKTKYRSVSSPCWGGIVLGVYIMGARDLWNHDALFDYKDRYMQATPDWRQTSKFIERMWDTYRADYSPVWTMSPKLTSVAAGGSIEKIPDKIDYVLGESVRIRAIADPGYEFAGWSGWLSGTENPTVIIMHSNRSIVADFVPAAAGPK